jgi:hypothetical protein
MSDVMRCPMHGAPLVPLSQKRWEEGPPDPNGYECGCDYGNPQPIRVSETAPTATERIFHCGCEKVDRCERDKCPKCCYCGRAPEIRTVAAPDPAVVLSAACDVLDNMSASPVEGYLVPEHIIDRLRRALDAGQRRPTAMPEGRHVYSVEELASLLPTDHARDQLRRRIEIERGGERATDQPCPCCEAAGDLNVANVKLTEVAHAAGNLLDAFARFGTDHKHPFVEVRLARLRGALDRAGHSSSDSHGNGAKDP